jgi:FixJ family two-component response regulator
VAVVDDDHRIRESLDSLLIAAGYRVLLFDSGENFLQDEGFANASCLISDVRIPGVDGFELYRRVLAEHPNLPVILISGHRNLQTSESIINSVFAYFDKPFEGKGLMTAVRAAVDQSSRSGFTCLEYRSKIMNLMQLPSRSADASLSERFALQTVPGRMLKMNGMVGGPVNSKGKRGRRSPNDLAERTTESNCVLPNIAVLRAELKRTRDMLRECEALANIGRMAHHIAHEIFLTIRVIDNGPGVSASIRESLFPRSVPTENRNGLGLGLAIAEQAAAGHGGFVCLEESRPGRTVFALHISVDQRQSHECAREPGEGLSRFPSASPGIIGELVMESCGSQTEIG